MKKNETRLRDRDRKRDNIDRKYLLPELNEAGRLKGSSLSNTTQSPPGRLCVSGKGTSDDKIRFVRR